MRKKFSSIKRINRRTIKSLPLDKPGVYGIFTNSGKLQKVGRAKRGRLQNRVLESAKEIREKKRQATKFAFISTKTIEEAKRLETRLIKKRKPPFNKEKKGK